MCAAGCTWRIWEWLAGQVKEIDVFGYSEEQIAAFGLSFGVGAFILYMVFVVGQLAWESKAGKFGTLVIFIGLALGMAGFVAKGIIQWVIEK